MDSGFEKILGIRDGTKTPGVPPCFGRAKILTLLEAEEKRMAEVSDTAELGLIVPARYRQLKKLVWNRDVERGIPAEEVLEIYENNWRHVDKEDLSEDERQLIDRLVARCGYGQFLGSE